MKNLVVNSSQLIIGSKSVKKKNLKRQTGFGLFDKLFKSYIGGKQSPQNVDKSSLNKNTKNIFSHYIHTNLEVKNNKAEILLAKQTYQEYTKGETNKEKLLNATNNILSKKEINQKKIYTNRKIFYSIANLNSKIKQNKAILQNWKSEYILEDTPNLKNQKTATQINFYKNMNNTNQNEIIKIFPKIPQNIDINDKKYLKTDEYKIFNINYKLNQPKKELVIHRFNSEIKDIIKIIEKNIKNLAKRTTHNNVDLYIKNAVKKFKSYEKLTNFFSSETKSKHILEIKTIVNTNNIKNIANLETKNANISEKRENLRLKSSEKLPVLSVVPQKDFYKLDLKEISLSKSNKKLVFSKDKILTIKDVLSSDKKSVKTKIQTNLDKTQTTNIISDKKFNQETQVNLNINKFKNKNTKIETLNKKTINTHKTLTSIDNNQISKIETKHKKNLKHQRLKYLLNKDTKTINTKNVAKTENKNISSKNKLKLEKIKSEQTSLKENTTSKQKKLEKLPNINIEQNQNIFISYQSILQVEQNNKQTTENNKEKINKINVSLNNTTRKIHKDNQKTTLENSTYSKQDKNLQEYKYLEANEPKNKENVKNQLPQNQDIENLNFVKTEETKNTQTKTMFNLDELSLSNNKNENINNSVNLQNQTSDNKNMLSNLSSMQIVNTKPIPSKKLNKIKLQNVSNSINEKKHSKNVKINHKTVSNDILSKVDKIDIEVKDNTNNLTNSDSTLTTAKINKNINKKIIK